MAILHITFINLKFSNVSKLSATTRKKTLLHIHKIFPVQKSIGRFSHSFLLISLTAQLNYFIKYKHKIRINSKLVSRRKPKNSTLQTKLC